jgi:NAD-dependent dihydropyrimidine dehydrogenase PreA subunit
MAHVTKNPIFDKALEERTAADYLAFVADDIKMTVVATVDDEGRPVTAAVDMMDADEQGILFLTARGKSLYRRLRARGYLSLTGLVGPSTMESVAVSLAGEVREEGPELLPSLFAKNPFMYDIYPSEESRRALTTFRVWRGSGEWFDLSRHPIERASFAWGQGAESGAETTRHEPYVIGDACIGCGTCVAACPQACIERVDADPGVSAAGERGAASGHPSGRPPYRIVQRSCLHCGRCYEVCPVHAVICRL